MQELACPLPWNLPRGCDLRLDLNICELKRQPSALPRYSLVKAMIPSLTLLDLGARDDYGPFVNLTALQPCTPDSTMSGSSLPTAAVGMHVDMAVLLESQALPSAGCSYTDLLALALALSGCSGT